jgi:hypothetical protein
MIDDFTSFQTFQHIANFIRAIDRISAGNSEPSLRKPKSSRPATAGRSEAEISREGPQEPEGNRSV